HPREDADSALAPVLLIRFSIPSDDDAVLESLELEAPLLHLVARFALGLLNVVLSADRRSVGFVIADRAHLSGAELLQHRDVGTKGFKHERVVVLARYDPPLVEAGAIGFAQQQPSPGDVDTEFFPEKLVDAILHRAVVAQVDEHQCIPFAWGNR